jgi:CubicO group peptidase (beta-lactamase class C family)
MAKRNHKRKRAPIGQLAGLDDYIEQARKDWKNVGLAVAVVQGDQVLYVRGFGVREHGRHEQVDANTLFQIGSTTKSFAAAALGILVDDGKIGWDEPIIKHLPAFQLVDPWLTRQVTIRDVLAHRSGISHSYYPFLAVTDSDEAVRQLRYVNPSGAFRDSYVYSNLMYAVAGKVTEAASGMSWHDFVRRRLLVPLEMSRSNTTPYAFWDAEYVAPTYLGTAPAGTAGIGDARDSNVAMPHVLDDDGSVTTIPWRSYDTSAPAGSIVSSATDMAHWIVAHLNEGDFRGERVLRKETLRELHAAQNVRAGPMPFPFDAAEASYAMGWSRMRYRDRVHLAHSGGIVGFPAYVALMPEQKLGIAVLSNSAEPLHKSIALWVFDRLLDEPLLDWSHDSLQRARNIRREAQRMEEDLRKSRLPDTLQSLPLERYVGWYEYQGEGGRVSVRLDGEHLALTFPGRGAFSGRLEHWHHDLFRLRSGIGVSGAVGPQFVGFTLGPAGTITSMSAFEANFRRLPSEWRT